MKKIFSFVIMMVACVCFAQAQSLNDYVGTYIGTLHDIQMNGKDGYADQQMTFTITADGYLTGQIGKIGSMPGVITINMEIGVEDGELVAYGDYAGVLNFSFGGSTNLNIDEDEGGFSGTIDASNKMDFTLNVIGSMLGIPMFPASVSFTSSSFIPAN